MTYGNFVSQKYNVTVSWPHVPHVQYMLYIACICMTLIESKRRSRQHVGCTSEHVVTRTSLCVTNVLNQQSARAP
jgi:hypothetical protein